MTNSPKHLWSGNWRSEPGHRPGPPQRVGEHEPESRETRRESLGRHRRDLAVALLSAAAAVAATMAVLASLGDLSTGNSGVAGHTRRAAAHNDPYGVTADWLGMEIGGSPTGIYINAMNTSGAAIVSGLEPGDQIVAIDNHTINTVLDVRSDTDRLKLGTPVEITVMRSSVEVRSQLIPMMQRPTIHR